MHHQGKVSDLRNMTQTSFVSACFRQVRLKPTRLHGPKKARIASLAMRSRIAQKQTGAAQNIHTSQMLKQSGLEIHLEDLMFRNWMTQSKEIQSNRPSSLGWPHRNALPKGHFLRNLMTTSAAGLSKNQWIKSSIIDVIFCTKRKQFKTAELDP